MKNSFIYTFMICAVIINACGYAQNKAPASQKSNTNVSTDEGNIMNEKVVKTDDEWRELLTDEEYYILRKKGTERAFTGEFNEFKGKGVFLCAGCGNELFSSDSKFDSGTGWPSFWEPISEQNIETEEDNSLFTRRTEILCSRCGGHLGHVFEDGPKPTGLRYCINSAALDLKEPDDSDMEK